MNIESTPEETINCYRHPETETLLRCNRCNKPICPQCARQSHVGYRCPECTHELQNRHFSSEDKNRYINPFRVPREKPQISYYLLGLIIAIWIFQEMMGGSMNDDTLINLGASYGPAIILHGELWRFFTSMFLHIGIQHLLFNGFALYIFGREVETLFGKSRFLVIYILAGLFGSLLSFTIRGGAQFSAGASGAIFGLIGADLAFFVYYRKQLGSIGKEQVQRMMWLIGINLVLGFTAFNIDNAAHIGGLVSGFFLGLGFTPRYLPHLLPDGRNFVKDEGSLKNRWWFLLLSISIFIGSTWFVYSYWVNFYAN